MTSPSAAMTNTATYFAGAPLPKGSSSATVARIKGGSGYVWKASTLGSNGDKTDNAALDKLVKVNPADCAALEMDSSATIAPDGKSGILVVNTKATAGTAILLRGYEYTSPTPPESADDLETNENSSLKWFVLMVGPFDLNSSNCNALVIPFTVETSITNLYFVNDGEAKSLPLEIECPANIVVTCGQPVVYQPVMYAGCGDIQVDYSPPANTSFPVGVTPVVVTIKDQFGNSTNCTFTVTVMDLTPPVVPTLPVLTGECSVQVPAPTTIDICSGTSNLVTGVTTDPTNYDMQGSFTVHWRFDDGNGNGSTANQTVNVRDVTPPVKPVLTNLTYSYCGSSATPPTPTTTDNCAGTVAGTTTTSFPITTAGTTVVTWTFNDGNGNTTTATQNVTVASLTLSGFYSPINGTGGTCSAPLRTINLGSKIPIKFDLMCDSTPITSGQPPVVIIQAYSNNCVAGANLVDANAVYQNDWHYNWDSTGWTKGTYKVIVILPDGTSQYAFIKLK
ncbi:MAG: HYR domain-containing protein [Verrucomicrobiales bacterium]|nr:HYR domain-containing protein [Verrucomicrobiales bacterium]